MKIYKVKFQDKNYLVKAENSTEAARKVIDSKKVNDATQFDVHYTDNNGKKQVRSVYASTKEEAIKAVAKELKSKGTPWFGKLEVK